jgi:hypothetical protein
MEIATFVTPDVGPAGESLTFRLTVTDYSGAVSIDTCVVNVTWVNMPPVADAGPDQLVSEGDAVTLSAANSSDPDGAIDGYLWEQTGGPAVALSDPAAVSPAFTAPDTDANGATLEFQLTVADSGGLQATDTCIVHVGPGTAPLPPTGNQPPTADAGPDMRVKQRSFVALDGTGSSDPDDGIATYRWDQISGPGVCLSSSFSAEPNFQAPVVRRRSVRLVFKLTVKDYAGNRSKDNVTVTVVKNDDEDEKKDEKDYADEEEKEHDDDKDDGKDHKGDEPRSHM